MASLALPLPLPLPVYDSVDSYCNFFGLCPDHCHLYKNPEDLQMLQLLPIIQHVIGLHIPIPLVHSQFLARGDDSGHFRCVYTRTGLSLEDFVRDQNNRGRIFDCVNLVGTTLPMGTPFRVSQFFKENVLIKLLKLPVELCKHNLSCDLGMDTIDVHDWTHMITLNLINFESKVHDTQLVWRTMAKLIRKALDTADSAYITEKLLDDFLRVMETGSPTMLLTSFLEGPYFWNNTEKIDKFIFLREVVKRNPMAFNSTNNNAFQLTRYKSFSSSLASFTTLAMWKSNYDNQKPRAPTIIDIVGNTLARFPRHKKSFGSPPNDFPKNDDELLAGYEMAYPDLLEYLSIMLTRANQL